MTLRPLDLVIIAVYLVAITVFGVALRRRHGSLDDYFLAGSRLPWWAIAFSIVAAETSVLTIISVPGLAFAGDFGFLQLVLGFLVARILISLILIPAYFRGRLNTAYQLLRQRFGPKLQALAALIFLVGRSLAEGVRFFAIAIVADVILHSLPPGWHLHVGNAGVLAVVALLTLVYTFAGGLRAVVWTDFIQMCLYVGGACLSLWLLLGLIPGGWSQVVAAAAPAHKLRVFDFGFSWTRTYTFWSGLIGGTFLTMATHGTDQLMVQRLLAARSEGDSKRALLGSWILLFFQFLLFLMIGAALFAYNRVQPLPTGAGMFGRYDRLYPEFIAAHFPAGLAGLALAAILAAAMSNLSAALNSLASSTIFDFYLPRWGGGRSPASAIWLSRLATLFWMAVLAAVAYAARSSRSVLESGLAIISFPFSALLGVFLLGTLTRRANEFGAIVGVVFGIATTLLLNARGVAYTWFAVAGTLVTMGVGYLVSCLHAGREAVG